MFPALGMAAEGTLRNAFYLGVYSVCLKWMPWCSYIWWRNWWSKVTQQPYGLPPPCFTLVVHQTCLWADWIFGKANPYLFLFIYFTGIVVCTFFSGSRLVWAQKSTRVGSRGRNGRLGGESPPFIGDELFCLCIWTCSVVLSYFSVLLGPFCIWGLLSYYRWCNCKCKRKKGLYFLQNCFICVKTKLFLTRSLNFAFLHEYVFNVSM